MHWSRIKNIVFHYASQYAWALWKGELQYLGYAISTAVDLPHFPEPTTHAHPFCFAKIAAFVCAIFCWMPESRHSWLCCHIGVSLFSMLVIPVTATVIPQQFLIYMVFQWRSWFFVSMVICNLLPSENHGSLKTSYIIIIIIYHHISSNIIIYRISLGVTIFENWRYQWFASLATNKTPYSSHRWWYIP